MKTTLVLLRQLARKGTVKVSSPTRGARRYQVRYIPNPDDPQHSGTLAIDVERVRLSDAIRALHREVTGEP